MRWRIDGCIGRVTAFAGAIHSGLDDSLLDRSSPPVGRAVKTIVRSHRLASDDQPRDSSRYSITAAEWPAVRAHLAALSASRAAVG
jgi:hypothetical protein